MSITVLLKEETWLLTLFLSCTALDFYSFMLPSVTQATSPISGHPGTKAQALIGPLAFFDSY